MTDGLQSDVNQNQVSPIPVAPEQTAQPEQRLFRQDEVNDIVRQRVNAVHQKAKQDALTELQAQQQSQQNNNVGTLGGMQQMNQDQIQKLVSEKLDQERRMVAAQHIMGQFNQKMQKGPEKYSDFDEKVRPLVQSLDRVPNLMMMVTHTDNAEDIMYDLANNPEKIGNLATLTEDPRMQNMAVAAINKLSNSIKQNQSAANIKTPKEPLDQLKPSTNVGMDNGSRKVKDYRTLPQFKA